MFDAIRSGFYWVFLMLDMFFYWFIDIMYQIFMALASVQILNSEAITRLTQRVYVVVGVFMLFMLAYSLLTSMINPEGMNKGKSSPGNVIKNVVITLVFLVFTPAMFNFLYTAQNVIVTDNVIGNIIMGNEDNEYNNAVDTGLAGRLIAADVFGAFFYDSDLNDGITPETEYAGRTFYLDQVKADLRTMNASGVDANPFYIFTLFVDNVVDGEITYVFFISAIFAIAVAYLFVTFSIDLAVRSLKLAYLQVIAPIPIIFNVLPGKESVFHNWIKKSLTVFAEVFVRLLVVYFIVFTISLLPSFWDNFFGNSTIASGSIEFIAKAFIIVGVCLFGKMAPKFITETIGVKGDGLDLGIMKKLPGAAAIPGMAKNAIRGYNDKKDLEGKEYSKPKRLLNAAKSGIAGGYHGLTNSWNAQKLADHKKAMTTAMSKTDAMRQAGKINTAERQQIMKDNENINTPFGAWMHQRGKDVKKWAGAEIEMSAKIKEFKTAVDAGEKFKTAGGNAMTKKGTSNATMMDLIFDKNGDVREGFESKGADLDVVRKMRRFNDIGAAREYMKNYSIDSELRLADQRIADLRNEANSFMGGLEQSQILSVEQKAKHHGNILHIDSQITDTNNTITALKSELTTANDVRKEEIEGKLKILAAKAANLSSNRATEESKFNAIAIPDGENAKGLFEKYTASAIVAAEKETMITNFNNEKSAMDKAIFAMQNHQNNLLLERIAKGTWRGATDEQSDHLNGVFQTDIDQLKPDYHNFVYESNVAGINLEDGYVEGGKKYYISAVDGNLTGAKRVLADMTAENAASEKLAAMKKNNNQ